MSQHDYDIVNAGGAAVRGDINAALAAILSMNSGATAPTVTRPFMWWYDTSANQLKYRNSADTGWVLAFDSASGLSRTDDGVGGNSVPRLSQIAALIPPQTSKIQSITAAINAGALTVSLNPTTLDFRNPTLSNGAASTVQVSTAISLTLPTGASLGSVADANTLNRIAIIAINSSAGVELAAVNISGGLKLDETNTFTTTAVSGTSTSSTAVYSTTARTTVAYRVVGFIDALYGGSPAQWQGLTLAQGTGGQALASLSSFGFGQTLQSLTVGAGNNRSLGTTYYNATGKPILVHVVGTATAGTNITFTVNGVSLQGGALPNAGNSGGQTQIIPPGASYVVSGSINLTGWAELR